MKVLNDREALSREELNKKNERLAADEEARRERQKIMKETTEIEAQKRKRIAEIEAEKEAAVAALRAEGDLQAAQKQADALQIKADAEAYAADKVAFQRAYHLESKRLDILKALAGNEKMVIAGNNGDNLIAQVTAAARSFDLFDLRSAAERYGQGVNGDTDDRSTREDEEVAWESDDD